MKAGRELDALIAEKVMGWTSLKGFESAIWDCGNSPIRTKESWLPSTQIADAWLVVEKIAKEAYVDIGVDKHGAQVQIDVFKGGKWNLASTESTRAASAPLAICLAALKAIA